MVGGFIGPPKSAAIYIAGFIALLFALAFIVCLFVPLGNGIERGEALRSLAALCATFAAYVFGALTGRR